MRWGGRRFAFLAGLRPHHGMAAAKKAARARSRPAGKTPGKSPAHAVVPMREQPHGGALRTGGTNKGGPGRPKSEVRAAALEGAEKAIPKLVAMIENKTLHTKRPEVVIQASERLLKYGLGTQTEVSVEDVKHRLTRTLTVLREELAPEILARVLGKLKPIWS